MISYPKKKKYLLILTLLVPITYKPNITCIFIFYCELYLHKGFIATSKIVRDCPKQNQNFNGFQLSNSPNFMRYFRSAFITSIVPP